MKQIKALHVAMNNTNSMADRHLATESKGTWSCIHACIQGQTYIIPTKEIVNLTRG